jgi:Rrf2 family protein
LLTSLSSSFYTGLDIKRDMMCFSHTTGYAIQALACMEGLGRQLCFVRDIAARTGVPRPYLARIMNQLAHQGIVSTKRGYRGGIALVRPASQITLLDVVKATEGDPWFGQCMLGIRECGDNKQLACPLREFWEDICQQIEQKLRATTLADVLARLGKGPLRKSQSPAARQKPPGRSVRPQPVRNRPGRLAGSPVSDGPLIGEPDSLAALSKLS